MKKCLILTLFMMLSVIPILDLDIVNAASKPATPKLLKASTVITKAKKAKVKLTWKKVTGATKYAIYRSNKVSKGYKLVKRLKGTKFTGKYEKTKNIYFKVRAIRNGVMSSMSLYAAVRPGIKGYNTTSITLDSMFTEFTQGKEKIASGSANGKLAKTLGVRFVSDDPSVVSIVKYKKNASTGKCTCYLKAKKAGKTTVYMIAPNGVYLSKNVKINSKNQIENTDATVPDVIGMDSDKASETVLAAGLKWNLMTNYCKSEESFNEQYPGKTPGTVIEMYSDKERTKVLKPGTTLKYKTPVYCVEVRIEDKLEE